MDLKTSDINCFTGHGLLINGIIFLSPREALTFLEHDVLLLDIRDDQVRNGRDFKVKSVLMIPMTELASRLSEIPRDKPLILADCLGLASKIALELLVENGFDKIAVLNGGMIDWEKDGLPTIVDHDEELTGSCACRLRPSKVYRPRGGC